MLIYLGLHFSSGSGRKITFNSLLCHETPKLKSENCEKCLPQAHYTIISNVFLYGCIYPYIYCRQPVCSISYLSRFAVAFPKSCHSIYIVKVEDLRADLQKRNLLGCFSTFNTIFNSVTHSVKSTVYTAPIGKTSERNWPQRSSWLSITHIFSN